MTETDLKAKYDGLKPRRQSFLDRARVASALTIPSLLPPEGHNGTTTFPTTYQGLGARGASNLTNRLFLTIVPPNEPFFRLEIDEARLEALAPTEEIQTELDESLVKTEGRIMKDMEASHLRVSLFEDFEHQVVTGNALLYLPKKNKGRVYPLSRYVVERDGDDRMVWAVTQEAISWDAVPEAMQAEMERRGTSPSQNDDKSLDLYTGVYWDGSQYKSYQQVGGVTVPDSEASYPEKLCPWQAHRYIRVSGEDYGRGAVEPHLGDLKALESLSKAGVEAAAIMARMLILVAPSSPTRIADLEATPNGGIVIGREQDITFLQAGKTGDLQTTRALMATIEERLSFAFLLNSAVQRSGERVTAEEIRTMSSELESALGGAYSQMALDVQLPLVELVMGRLKAAGKLPKMPKGIVRPTIITGLQALGRGADYQKLTTLLQTLQGTIGQEAMETYINLGEVIDRVMNAIGVNPEGLRRSDEEVAQRQQATNAQALLERGAPNAINAAANAGGGEPQQ